MMLIICFSLSISCMESLNTNHVSLQKIVVVKVYAPVAAENFINIKFKGFRGAKCVEDDFSHADLPCMNQHYWICFLFYFF